jgi:hypothetical protein
MNQVKILRTTDPRQPPLQKGMKNTHTVRVLSQQVIAKRRVPLELFMALADITS